MYSKLADLNLMTKLQQQGVHTFKLKESAIIQFCDSLGAYLATKAILCP